MVKNFKNKKHNNKLMSCISPSPNSEFLIRWTNKLALSMNIYWFAVYVETSEKLTENEEEILKRNINLVKELGGEVIIVHDNDIVNGIVKTAEKYCVSQIIVGKPLYKTLKQVFYKSNLIDKLIKYSKDIDISLISSPGIKTDKRKLLFPKINIRRNLFEYLISILTILFVSILSLYLLKFIDYWAIALIYLAIITILALFLSRFPVLLSAILSGLIWDFIFIPPVFSFYPDKLKDLYMLLVYLIAAIVIGSLTSKIKLREISLTKSERKISTLYRLSEIIINSNSLYELIEQSIKLIEKKFDSKVNIILVEDKVILENKPHASSSFLLNNKSFNLALWAFQNKKEIGKFTNTVNMSDIMSIPLIVSDDVLGVISLKFKDNHKLAIEQKGLLLELSKQLSMAITRKGLLIKNKLS